MNTKIIEARLLECNKEGTKFSFTSRKQNA
jgi:hypothetical protein